MHARRDQGQLLPLYAVILLVACGAMVLLAHLGQVAHRRAQARTAADAAALAGAAEGREAADAVATANGAALDGFVADATGVDVRVSVGGVHAIARAERGKGCQLLPQVDPLNSAGCQPTNRG